MALMALTVLTFIYYQVGSYLPHNSDNAALLLESKSILGGNLFLNHWKIAPDNFWTLDLPYFVFFSLFSPLNPHLMALVPSFIFSALLITASLLTFRHPKDQSLAVRILGLIITLIFLGALPPVSSSFFADTVLTGPIHLCTIWYVILILWIRVSYSLPQTSSLTPNQSSIRPFFTAFLLMTLLWTLVITGDPFSMVIGILPMLIAEFLLAWKKQTGWKNFLLSSASIACGMLFAKIFLLFMRNGHGFSPGWTVQSDFIAFNALPDHLLKVVQSLIDINGANIFGYSYVVADTWVKFSKLFFLLITLSLAIHVTLNFFKNTGKRYNFVLCFSSLVVLLNISSVIFSQAADDAAGVHRYLLPARIFGILLLANWLPDYLEKIGKTDRIAYMLLSFATGFVLLGTTLESLIGWGMQINSAKVVGISNPFEGNPFESEQLEVASWLLQNKISTGYSQYWNSQILTVLTYGKVKVLPIEYSEGQIRPKIAFVSSLAYERFRGMRPTFVVIGPNGEAGITLDHLTLAFSRPDRLQKIGHFLIAVWDNGIRVRPS